MSRVAPYREDKAIIHPVGCLEHEAAKLAQDAKREGSEAQVTILTYNPILFVT